MKIRLKRDKQNLEGEVKTDAGGIQVTAFGETVTIDAERRDEAEFFLRLGDGVITAFAVRQKDELFVHLNGRTWRLKDVSDQTTATASAGDGDNRIVAPMPGSVIKLLVNMGDIVQRNQPLVIVEAMKMENEVRAGMDGRVDKVLVMAGQQVGYGELLMELAPSGKPGDAVAA